MDFLSLHEVFFLIGIPWGQSYPYRPSFFSYNLIDDI
jgi:hypothetical protein